MRTPNRTSAGLRAVPGSAALLLLAAIATASVTAIRADTVEDDRIRQRVTARLLGQISVHPEGLEIAVENGVVRLRGSVASVGEREKLQRIVGGVVGVVGVDNELSIRSSNISEMAIMQEVRRQLDRRPRFRTSDLQVSAAGTEVLLTGTVERALDRLEAGEIAAGVAGVTHVDNRLEVRRRPGQDDAKTGARVRGVLANPLTFGVVRNLSVEVVEGRVTLRGMVARQADREQAERLALGVPGVLAVDNQIEVGGS